MLIKERIMGFKTRAWFSGILVLGLGLVLTLCGGCAQKQAEKTKAEKVVNVRVMPAQKSMLQPSLEVVGSLKPFEEVSVSAEVDANLKAVLVDEGSRVTTGMVLAQADDTNYRLNLKQAESGLRQAEATVTNTQTEYERKSALVKEELVSKQQMDEVTTRLALATNQRDNARAALSLVQERLAKCSIRSPLGGMVKEKKVSAGDFVHTGMPLFTIIQNNPLKLSFVVSEKDAALLDTGQEVKFTVDSRPGKTFGGKVNMINPSVEERSRTLKVEAQVPNAQGELKPGIFARVSVYTGAPHSAIVIPVTALIYEEQNVKVYINQGGVARDRKITTGRKYGEMMEVLEGLQENDSVIVVGQNNLTNGTKINVLQ